MFKLMRFVLLSAAAAVALAACGGGGGSSNGMQTPPAGTTSPGSLTLLVGDGPLDNVERVDITIEEIRLLGGEDGQVVLADETIGPLNLLDLRNITELLFDGEVPAGTYSKIRLIVSDLQITEVGGAAESAQLPGNGKIDLNPQGEFTIDAGEDLVIQIDFDLDRSVHIVQTGNSRYKFRPVVFINVLDQTDNLRLTRLFGDLQADIVDTNESDLDVCLIEDGQLLDADCVDVIFAEQVLALDADGLAIQDPLTLLDSTGHLFGHYFMGAQGGRFFRALALIGGEEDSLTQIDGEVESAVVDEAFSLRSDDTVDPYTVMVAGALLLDDMGALLTTEIMPGQEAEAWAQNVAIADAAQATDFPAFLVQVDVEVDDEDSVEGIFTAFDGDQLTLLDEGVQRCVLFTGETEIQLITEDGEGAATEVIDYDALVAMVDDQVEVEAFGEIVEECLVAEQIVVEIEGDSSS